MTHKYFTTQYLTISSAHAPDIELRMDVVYTVHPGSPSTEIDPPEAPSVEIHTNLCFIEKEGKNGECGREILLPDELMAALTETEEFKQFLLTEAREQYIAAEEEAADHKREMMRERDL